MAVAAPAEVQQIEASHQRPVRSMVREAFRRLESVVYRPDPAMMWIKPATEAAVNACHRTGAEVVWATGGPWSSLVIARNVSVRTGIPYVLDLRDAWTLTHSEFEMRQPEWIKARDRRLLSRLFSGAQAVVLRYESEAESYWRAYPGALDPARVHLIPNGYDGSIGRFEIPRGDRCTVLFTGFIGPYWYEDMLHALAQLKTRDPERARKLRLVFVGEGTEDVAAIAARLGLGDIIETTGLVPFAEANRLQSEAHALLLLGWRPARGHELGGSKIFGYLKARRPIVGILPRDEQARILRSVGVETIAYAGAHEEIAGVFTRLVDAWSAGDLAALLPDAAACETYSAERQTQALARALEGRPAMDAFQPGACPVPPSLQQLIGPEGWTKPLRASVSYAEN
jgi:hypothetical protein